MFSKYSKALMRLFKMNPVIYGFAKILPIKEDRSIPTAATNGRQILVNPDFWSSLDVDSQVFVLAHEALHLGYDFFGRTKGRNPRTFNVAQDLVINEFLFSNQFTFSMPDKIITASKFPDMGYNPHEWTSERVYNWLVQNQDKDALESIVQNSVLTDCGRESETNPLSSQEVQDLRMAVQSVVTAAPPGSIPQELVKAVESAWVPPHDWASELSQYLNALSPTDYSLKKMAVVSYGVSGVISPTLNYPGIEKVGVIFDTSASMDEFFSRVVGVIKDILTQVCVRTVHRMDADIRVAYEEETTPSSMLDSPMEFRGGGGTSFCEALERMGSHSPDVVLYITDGYGVFPSTPPSYPLVWVDLSGTVEYPFGDVVRCRT
jgi:predicted metal-dependent peptidase